MCITHLHTFRGRDPQPAPAHLTAPTARLDLASNTYSTRRTARLRHAHAACAAILLTPLLTHHACRAAPLCPCLLLLLLPHAAAPLCCRWRTRARSLILRGAALCHRCLRCPRGVYRRSEKQHAPAATTRQRRAAVTARSMACITEQRCHRAATFFAPPPRIARRCGASLLACAPHRALLCARYFLLYTRHCTTAVRCRASRGIARSTRACWHHARARQRRAFWHTALHNALTFALITRLLCAHRYSA